MNMLWILYSLVMFVASNVLYLAIRRAQFDKIAAPVYSVGLFGIPAGFYLVLALIYDVSLKVEWWQMGVIAVTAILWSFLGNYFSQKGVLLAPNPGYSLVLQKSYVIVTTFAAVVLFAAELTALKVLAIALIVLFLAVISIHGEKKKTKHYWVWFSLGAHLCFAFGALMSKYFLTLGWEPYMYLFYISLIVAVLNGLEVLREKKPVRLTFGQWGLVGVIGVASMFFSLFMQLGYRYAPNPGYVSAVNTSSIVALTVLSAYFYRDHLSRQKLIGVVGVTVGLLLLLFV